MSDEEGGSVLGELGNAADAVWNAGAAAADAAWNAGGAAIDAAQGAGEVVGEGFVGIAAGAAYAVQADETAASLRDTQNEIIDAAQSNFDQAGAEMDQAGEDVWGR